MTELTRPLETGWLPDTPIGDSLLRRFIANQADLQDHLAGATGLGGRARSMGRTAERARVAVRKAIAAALDRIDAEDPAMARVLRRTIHTGSVCRYERDPDTPIDWLL